MVHAPPSCLLISHQLPLLALVLSVSPRRHSFSVALRCRRRRSQRCRGLPRPRHSPRWTWSLTPSALNTLTPPPALAYGAWGGVRGVERSEEAFKSRCFDGVLCARVCVCVVCVVWVVCCVCVRCAYVRTCVREGASVRPCQCINPLKSQHPVA